MVKSRRKEIRFDEDQHDEVERLAKSKRVSFADIVRMALDDYLRNNQR